MTASPMTQMGRLVPNTIYLTFNQPEKNEYHRGIFITSLTPTPGSDSSSPSGTLFHAVFANGRWDLERRTVGHIVKSKSLVLMWRIAPVNPTFSVDEVEEMLKKVPCCANGREVWKDLNLPPDPRLGNFNCVAWTEQALMTLEAEGFISVDRDMRVIVREARAAAGPKDATLMVGKDFGGLRVINGTM